MSRSNRLRRFRRFPRNPRPKPGERAARTDRVQTARRARSCKAAATVYTLIESARLAKLDVVTYLANVLARVASRPASRNDELLPQNWVASSASPARTSEVVLAELPDRSGDQASGIGALATDEYVKRYQDAKPGGRLPPSAPR